MSVRPWKPLSARLFALLAVAFVLSAASCFHRESEWLVPEEATARDQFSVARRQESDARGMVDGAARKIEMEKAVLAYEKVEQLFPSDTEYTPVAAFTIGTLHQDMKEHGKAVDQFTYVLNKYPSDTQVRLRGLYGMGVSLDDLGRPQEAQQYYKLLIDEFSQTTEPATREIVDMAIARYRQIRPIRK